MKETLQLTYGAKLSRDEGGFLVTFRDLDNVFTWGESEEEAVFNAQEALDGVLESLVANDQEIPVPSKLLRGEVAVTVSPDVAAPVLLHQLRTAQHKTLADVAHALGKSYQSYQRMERRGGNLTLKSLKQAAAAMGATVEIRLHRV